MTFDFLLNSFLDSPDTIMECRSCERLRGIDRDLGSIGRLGLCNGSLDDRECNFCGIDCRRHILLRGRIDKRIF